jgi:ABC-type multidrug transport system fused ATPase/permease subunit
VLVIEHRPALARLADRVVRLADGKAVVEPGTATT